MAQNRSCKGQTNARLPDPVGLLTDSFPASSPLSPQPSNKTAIGPVLLTGATGFIGRRIQRLLLDSGIPLRIIIRPGSRHRRFADSRCEIHDCELTDKKGLSEALEGVSTVVYCAGSVRGRQLADFLPANVDGVRAMVEAINQQTTIPPVLLISSLAASRPDVSDYAQSKYLGEEVLTTEAKSCWSILRPSAVYGPGDTEMEPILKMARSGLVFRPGPGNQRLSFLHADDLASAVFAWLQSCEQCSGQTFSIDDGHEGGYSWTDIAQAATSGRFLLLGIPKFLLSGVAKTNLLLSKLLSYAPMLTPGKTSELTQADWLCDNTTFVKASGWQPSINLATGVRQSPADSL
jgi:nucleoside-diphosphate-sugar epimerase